MDIRPIRCDADLEDALREIERLWGAADGTPEGDKLDVLATLVDAYEAKRWPVRGATPLDILHYAIGDMGRSQKDLADLLGSRSMTSELLAGRRRISLDAAQKISATWYVPIQLLVMPYDLPNGRAA